MLWKFFHKELKPLAGDPNLIPLGKRIIECCLQRGGLDDFDGLLGLISDEETAGEIRDVLVFFERVLGQDLSQVSQIRDGFAAIRGSQPNEQVAVVTTCSIQNSFWANSCRYFRHTIHVWPPSPSL